MHWTWPKVDVAALNWGIPQEEQLVGQASQVFLTVLATRLEPAQTPDASVETHWPLSLKVPRAHLRQLPAPEAAQVSQASAHCAQTPLLTNEPAGHCVAPVVSIVHLRPSLPSTMRPVAQVVQVPVLSWHCWQPFSQTEGKRLAQVAML